MNVGELRISPEVAAQKIREYQALVGARRSAEDEMMIRCFRHAKQNRAIVDLDAAFETAGLDEDGNPRIAICRSDMTQVWCYKGTGRCSFAWGPAMFRRWGWGGVEMNPNATRSIISVRTPGTKYLLREFLTTQVQPVPPMLRPSRGLHLYHTLFEVEKWDVEHVSVDPFLLKRIQGSLFAVVAEWELTPLESQIVASMRRAS